MAVGGEEKFCNLGLTQRHFSFLWVRSHLTTTRCFFYRHVQTVTLVTMQPISDDMVTMSKICVAVTKYGPIMGTTAAWSDTCKVGYEHMYVCDVQPFTFITEFSSKSSANLVTNIFQIKSIFQSYNI